LPERLEDFIDESIPVRMVDVFVDTLDLAEMSSGAEPTATIGRHTIHRFLLKVYVYG
jgi:hypothetical protein